MTDPSHDPSLDTLAADVDEELDEERASADPDPTRRENYGSRLGSLDDAVHGLRDAEEGRDG